MTAPTEAGTLVPIVWRGRRARAFVPDPLADRDLTPSHETVRKTATAAAIIETTAADLPADYAPLARLLLRAEGIASSYIEGLTAAVVDVVLAEQHEGSTAGTAGSAAWVAANLAAVTSAVEAAAASPLSVDLLCQWHQILMTGSPTPASLVGRIRSEQGWIGGTSPLDAVLVPPPPDALPALLDDLVDYVNHAEVDPVTQAAVAHAQFELIHPFGDGNGRVGRILVAYILTRRMSLLTPPPVSTGIAADVGGYSAGLALFRLGDHDRWIQWFADAVTGAGSAQRALVDRVEALRQEWRARLARTDPGLRSDSSVWRVLDLLPQHLLLTAPLLQQELDLSGPSARRALEVLAAAGVLTAHSAVSGPGRGRPRKLFVSHDLLGLTGSQPLR